MEIISDNLHPKVLKNRLFINAVDYLIDEKIVDDQKGISARTGIMEATLSNIRNDKKIVSDKTIRKFIESFPNIFNPEYFKGQNIYMTMKEAIEAKIYAEGRKRDEIVTEPQPEVPDYVKRLCEESARLATRNEMLERQCENLIAELRESKDKNDAFLVELKASQKFHDALVADLRISRTQNDTLIAELRETRKQNAILAKGLSDTLLSIEGMKNQMSMMLSHFNTSEKTNLSTLSVNDEGDPVIMIQVPDDTQDGKKSQKIFNGYIKGNVRFITDQMVQQAIKAFTDKKK